MEALRIIIEFIGAVLIAFMTYLFTKSHYERQRRDELADRELDRNIKFRDNKIEEVQTYVNILIDICRSIIMYERLATKNEEMDESVIAEYNKIPERLFSLQKFVGSFTALNDSELTDANTALIYLVTSECTNSADLADTIQNKRKFDAETILERVLNFETSTALLIRVMQNRIHKLASDLK